MSLKIQCVFHFLVFVCVFFLFFLLLLFLCLLLLFLFFFCSRLSCLGEHSFEASFSLFFSVFFSLSLFLQRRRKKTTSPKEKRKNSNTTRNEGGKQAAAPNRRDEETSPTRRRDGSTTQKEKGTRNTAQQDPQIKKNEKMKILGSGKSIDQVCSQPNPGSQPLDGNVPPLQYGTCTPNLTTQSRRSFHTSSQRCLCLEVMGVGSRLGNPRGAKVDQGFHLKLRLPSLCFLDLL